MPMPNVDQFVETACIMAADWIGEIILEWDENGNRDLKFAGSPAGG